MVARECQRTKEKLGIARSLTLERASERDQAVSMARDVAGFAAEAIQKLEELNKGLIDSVDAGAALKQRSREVGGKTQ